jgi:hypothetical protein
MARAANVRPNIAAPNRSDVQLLVLKNDISNSGLTIVIPAMKELTVGDFVAWCHEGIREAGAVEEILTVDSYSQGTKEIALAGLIRRSAMSYRRSRFSGVGTLKRPVMTISVFRDTRDQQDNNLTRSLTPGRRPVALSRWS